MICFSQASISPPGGAANLWTDSHIQYIIIPTTFSVSVHIPGPLFVCYLDAVFVEEAGQGEAFLLVKGLAKDDQLLKEEDSPLLHTAEQPSLWVRHQERVLQQQAALSHNLPLKMNQMEGIRKQAAQNALSSVVLLSLMWLLTSNPCKRPTFIISLHLFGTMHMTSSALWRSHKWTNWLISMVHTLVLSLNERNLLSHLQLHRLQSSLFRVFQEILKQKK